MSKTIIIIHETGKDTRVVVTNQPTPEARGLRGAWVSQIDVPAYADHSTDRPGMPPGRSTRHTQRGAHNID